LLFFLFIIYILCTWAHSTRPPNRATVPTWPGRPCQPGLARYFRARPPNVHAALFLPCMQLDSVWLQIAVARFVYCYVWFQQGSDSVLTGWNWVELDAGVSGSNWVDGFKLVRFKQDSSRRDRDAKE